MTGANKIIDLIGGVYKVAEKVGRHQVTIEDWIKSGIIPEKYWSDLIELSEGRLTVRKLHLSNEEARGKNE